MIKRKRERILFWIVVVLVVLSGGYFYLFEGLRNQWNVLNEKIESRQDKLEKMNTNFARKKDIAETYERVTEKLHIEGSEGEQRSVILAEIDNLLKTSGLESKTRTPLPTESDGNFKIFYFDLPDIQCTPTELFLFLDLLEQFSSVLEVDRLIVRNFVWEDLDVTFRIDMKLSRLVFSEESEDSTRKRKRS